MANLHSTIPKSGDCPSCIWYIGDAQTLDIYSYNISVYLYKAGYVKSSSITIIRKFPMTESWKTNLNYYFNWDAYNHEGVFGDGGSSPYCVLRMRDT